MSNLFTLIKVQFLAFFFNGKKKKKSRNVSSSKISTVLLVLLAFGLCGYIYSKMFGEMLILSDSLNKLPVLMLAISGLLNFLLSFYATTSVLYGGKDYDFLSALPVTKLEIVLSKLIYIVLSDFLYTVAIMIPTILVYYNLGATFSALNLLNIIIMVVFSAFIPISLSIIVGLIIAVISAKSLHKNAIQLILTIAFLVCLFAFSFSLGYDTAEGSFFSFGALEKIYFMFPIALLGLDSIGFSLLFAGISLLAIVLITTFVSLSYSKVNTILSSRKTRKNFTLKKYEGISQKKALIKKEFQRLFSCPMYAINSLMGAFIALLLTVGIVVLRVNIDGKEADVVGIVLYTFLPSILSFMFLLSPITAPSISLEGQAFWILKTSPVKMKDVLNSKIFVNDIIFVPISVIFSVTLCIAFSLGFRSAVAISTSVLTALLSGRLGLFANILFPKMKWENENQPVKQGMSTFIVMIFAFIFSALFGVLGWFLPSFGYVWYYVIILSILVLLNAATIIGINNYGEYLLDKRINK